jgi:hypothetical protein
MKITQDCIYTVTYKTGMLRLLAQLNIFRFSDSYQAGFDAHNITTAHLGDDV